MNQSRVIIFAENKLYPTKSGHESFTFCPVRIMDGVATNVKEKPHYGLEAGKK